MTGLRRTDDRTFVGAMQWIDATIVNGWFAISFFGALVLTTLAGALHIRADGYRSTAAFGCLSWTLVVHGRGGLV